MLREIKLLNYLPPFLKEYREYQLIMKAENPEFQWMSDESERIKDNQFIVTADTEGIRKFEQLLNITSAPGDTLEMRRSRVLTRWNEVAVYTLQGLIQKLNSLHNGRKYELILVNEKYLLKLRTNLRERGQIDELDLMLDYFIPMNIQTDIRNEIEILEFGHLGIIGAVSSFQIYEY